MSGGPRSWLTPGLIGLHVLGLVAVALCTWGGFWQLGVYDSRQQSEVEQERASVAVPLDELWGPDDPFTRDEAQRLVTIDGEFAPADEQLWVTDREQDGRVGAWLVSPVLTDVVGESGRAAMLVVRGWAPEPTALPAVPSGPVELTGILQQGEGSGDPWNPEDRTIGALRLPALTNELPYDLYSGFALADEAATADGLEVVAPPDPDVSWTVGLKNLAYAFQWWVFAFFAAFMWWRMVQDSRSTAAGSLTT